MIKYSVVAARPVVLIAINITATLSQRAGTKQTETLIYNYCSMPALDTKNNQIRSLTSSPLILLTKLQVIRESAQSYH